jgi:hypothetical protein
MPLTPYQEQIARLLSANRSFDSYPAGGAAIHIEPRTPSSACRHPAARRDVLGRGGQGSRLYAVRAAGDPQAPREVHAGDFARLHLTEPVDLPAMKAAWLEALADADAFIRSRPPGEIGCLYYSSSRARFVAPDSSGPADAVPHYGRPGGVLPRIIEDSAMPRTHDGLT